MSDVSSRHRWSFAVLWCLVMSGALAGCGSGIKDVKKDLVSVSGKVTIDGKPLPRGEISFLSTDDPGKAYGGTIDASGNYSLAYSASSKGAAPGNYSVRVAALEGQATMGTGGEVAQPKSLIPEKYNAPGTSGLTAKVEKGKSNTINFDLKSN